MEENLSRLISFIDASYQRTAVIEALASIDGTPSSIAKRTGMRLQNVSRTLRELEGKGLVRLITPNAKKGRLYSLTDTCKELVVHLGTDESVLKRMYELLVDRKIRFAKGWAMHGNIIDEVTPDFVVLDEKKDPLAAIEFKCVPPPRGTFGSGMRALYQSYFLSLLEKSAFEAMDLKEVYTDLHSYLVIGGLERNVAMTYHDVSKFENKKYIDKILFRDEVEKIGDEIEKVVVSQPKRNKKKT